MITVLGFSEDFTICDRCGKSELKGTWTIENENGDIFRLGSSCISKKFEFSSDETKQLIANFKNSEKFKQVYCTQIAPIYSQMSDRLNNTFTVSLSQLPEHGKKIWNQIESDYRKLIEFRMKKYKLI